MVNRPREAMAAAAAGPGQELCPHCRRPFKRLRSHLPHCKAAPRPDSGSAPPPRSGLAPAAKPGSGPREAAAGRSGERPPSPGVRQGLPGATPEEEEEGRVEAARKGEKGAAEQGGGPGAGQPAEGKVEPAVEAVAKCLDLPPEEVEDVPDRLDQGAKIVIEKHRARVVRERKGAGAASARSRRAAEPAQPDPGEGKLPPGTASAETAPAPRPRKASASSKGQKGGGAKAAKVLQDPPEADCRNNPRDLVQQEATGRTVTEEKQMYLDVGAEYKAPLSALHTKNLHLSAVEGFRGHNEGTSKNYLTSIQKLRESEKQMVVVSEPILNARRDTELAVHQPLLHTSKSLPICLSRASGRSTQGGATGLEWFPDLHPNYHGLSIFPGKPFQEDVGITTKTPKGNFSEGQQGPLSERRLMDVRLGELPAWLAACDFSPQGLLGGVQKAWSSYYDKYINVKRGGPAGVSMLLAGYCLLSYGWNYQHIKCHRWRKYH